MAIHIYTYNNPYYLKSEPFWDEIKNAPHFCASQTLANAVKKVTAPNFDDGHITTVFQLVEQVFSYWQGTSCKIKQHTDIDNAIQTMMAGFDDNQRKRIYNAFLFNREDVFNSLRTLFELNVVYENINLDQLTREQKELIEVYRFIQKSYRKKDFELVKEIGQEQIDEAIRGALRKADEKRNHNTFEDINLDRIVIHGVHQFSPIILRTIEEISRYHDIILLFNYQKKYSNLYQTWIDIYSPFEADLSMFDQPVSYQKIKTKGNVLGNNIGMAIQGNISNLVLSDDVQLPIYEFDSVTEFADYVADIFDEAKKKHPDQPLKYMKEQFYSTDSSVNDLLKIYFPEQFKERQFLNYPLGHFFVAVANMWDINNNCLVISDMSDIVECLSSGILDEKYKGELNTIYNKMYSLFDGCTNIDEMLKRIKQLDVAKKRPLRSYTQYMNHVSYIHITEEESRTIIKALESLKELASLFYEDFETHKNNFKEFYIRVTNYLQNKILEDEQLEEEFKSIIQRVLDHLNEVKTIEASASFECLKATMSIYLQQGESEDHSAEWIVRNFEQIDGDALISGSKTYHFACLSDEDISSVNQRVFPWPLTDDFFELAQDPIDWKYQVYVNSRKEYKNFKRYALVYGLEFCTGGIKLSYIKNSKDHERNPFYLLTLLNCEVKPYRKWRDNLEQIDASDIQFESAGKPSITTIDAVRYKACPYKFLLESIVEGDTYYKDTFLITRYVEVLLEDELRQSMAGQAVQVELIMKELISKYKTMQRLYPFLKDVNRYDVINRVKERLLSNKKRVFPPLTELELQHMEINKVFLQGFLASKEGGKLTNSVLKLTLDEMKELEHEMLNTSNYEEHVNTWCKYCANKDLCVRMKY